ncbi:MAG: NUDIX hydrolase [Elusimicrobia bacterium]|nr:NUDIX hydrolase [Elusimicrobiota bacterium]
MLANFLRRIADFLSKKTPPQSLQKPQNRPNVLSEFSCGGVVLDGGRLLLICVKNMRNRKVWTFPKGHLEQNEKPRQAALREVEEETGYKCSIIRPLTRVRYYFSLRGQTRKKVVQWYLMRPLMKSGKPDAVEIVETRWEPIEKAKQMIQYPSDHKLLRIVESIVRGNRPPRQPPGPQIAKPQQLAPAAKAANSISETAQ